MSHTQIPFFEVWAADNSCYAQGNRFKLDDYLEFLAELPARERCLFATAPDVVGDAEATWVRAAPVLPKIRDLGYPAAYVAQDGINPETLDWDAFDCLFVGGTTEFKLSDLATDLVAEARLRKKWTHMGRVNSWRRFEKACEVGYGSCDGTLLVFGPECNLPRIQAWLARTESLEGGFTPPPEDVHVVSRSASSVVVASGPPPRQQQAEVVVIGGGPPVPTEVLAPVPEILEAPRDFSDESAPIAGLEPPVEDELVPVEPLVPWPDLPAKTPEAVVVQGEATALDLPDGSVELVVTLVPPLGGNKVRDHLEMLWRATEEMARVLAPTGSVFIGVEDGYEGRSLAGLPWRYATGVTDRIGLALRAEIVVEAPRNEITEDRVMRTHTSWFHFTGPDQYFAATDLAREPTPGSEHPLGAPVRSVWQIPSPARPTTESAAAWALQRGPALEVARRVILGWSPAAVCNRCGVALTFVLGTKRDWASGIAPWWERTMKVVGGACECGPPDPARSRPAVVLDPFGGAGAVPAVALALGRYGISVAPTEEECGVAQWRVSESNHGRRTVERARKMVDIVDTVTVETLHEMADMQIRLDEVTKLHTKASREAAALRDRVEPLAIEAEHRGNALRAYRGDARRMPFEDGFFSCVVTSPPYWGLRAYGEDPDEIGRGSLEQYLTDIMATCDEVARVLAPTGLFWLNIGDTYSGSGGAGGDYNSGGRKDGNARWKQGDPGIAPMQACLIPQRLALALQDSGWLIRQVITWEKGRVRPEDVRHVRRPLFSSEMIYMLARQRDHVFHSEGLVEQGSTWHFAPARKGAGHQAPFPDALPRRCILLSTQPGDRVLDPFGGTGCTARVADELGREGYSLDLYHEA